MSRRVDLSVIVGRWWRLRPALRFGAAGIAGGALIPGLGPLLVVAGVVERDGFLGGILASFWLSAVLMLLVWVMVVIASVPPVEASLSAYTVRLAKALGEVVGTMQPPAPVRARPEEGQE